MPDNPYMYIKGCLDQTGLWSNDIPDKQSSVVWYAYYYTLRCLRMIRLGGLPETMPEDKVKHLIMTAGSALVVDDNQGQLWATGGNWGGRKDQYYFPAQFTVSNPYLPAELRRTWDLETDRCALVKNDLYAAGLLPIISRWSRMLVETDLSLWIAAVNTRAAMVMHATDEDAKTAAQLYLKDILDGKLSVIGDKRNLLLDGIETDPGLHVQPGNEANAHIQELVELHQYVKAGLYNELGLQSQYNLKRERLTADETALNEDTLYPLVEHILDTWRQGFDRVNEIFGTQITVELAGPWEDNREQLDAELEQIEAGTPAPAGDNIEGGDDNADT